MSGMQQSTPPSPGWYPVAGTTGQERWWDGRAWTSRWRVVRAPGNPLALGFGSPAAFLAIGIAGVVAGLGLIGAAVIAFAAGGWLIGALYAVMTLLLAVLVAVSLANAAYGFRMQRERRAIGV